MYINRVKTHVMDMKMRRCEHDGMRSEAAGFECAKMKRCADEMCRCEDERMLSRELKSCVVVQV